MKFTAWDKEDVKHSEDLRESFKDALLVIEFPARLRTAPCGCWEVEVMTPFGNIVAVSHRCGQHMK